MKWRYPAIGLGLVLVFCLVFAPASLLRHVASAVPGTDIVSPRGSLWQGTGGLVVQGELIGEAAWSLQPLDLLVLQLAWEVHFAGRDARLAGLIAAAPGGITGHASGTIGAEALNHSLAQWDVRVQTPVTVDRIEAEWADRTLARLEGTLSWPGGQTLWQAQGSPATADFPALQGTLGSDAGVVTGLLVPTGGQIPVLQGSLAPDGTFTLKISKLLTRIVGQPWPGSDPDHAIVIEMVDDLF